MILDLFGIWEDDYEEEITANHTRKIGQNQQSVPRYARFYSSRLTVVCPNAASPCISTLRFNRRVL